MIDVEQAKRRIRDRVWGTLDRNAAVHPPGARGTIPHFVGAERAAARLAQLPQWTSATVIKSNPDKAQLPVRIRALTDGKTVYMAVPKLAAERPFYLLRPDRVDLSDPGLATSALAAATSPTVDVESMGPVDLIMCGSVAVNRDGARIGKGAGYSDIEVALLAEAGLLGPHTLFATTVHQLQVLDEPLPDTEHDFGLDLIITPNEIITCPSPRRTSGLIWDHLTDAKIAAIPALLRARARRNH